jgi:hypothetical protein
MEWSLHIHHGSGMRGASGAVAFWIAGSCAMESPWEILYEVRRKHVRYYTLLRLLTRRPEGILIPAEHTPQNEISKMNALAAMITSDTTHPTHRQPNAAAASALLTSHFFLLPRPPALRRRSYLT